MQLTQKYDVLGSIISSYTNLKGERHTSPCIIIIRGVFTNFHSNFSKAINITRKAVKYVEDNEEKGKDAYLESLRMTSLIISPLMMQNLTYML